MDQRVPVNVVFAPKAQVKAEVVVHVHHVHFVQVGQSVAVEVARDDIPAQIVLGILLGEKERQIEHNANSQRYTITY